MKIRVQRLETLKTVCFHINHWNSIKETELSPSISQNALKKLFLFKATQ